MAFNSGAAAQNGGQTYPIARAFGLVVLAALIALVILRHLFGSVSVSASGGVK